jgi:hypothetical protein
MVWKLTAAVSAAALAVRGVNALRRGAYALGFAHGAFHSTGDMVAAVLRANKGETEQ